MSRTFTLTNDWYGNNCKLYKATSVKFNTGVTCLVGCNGSGKTTMLYQIRTALKKKDIPFFEYNNEKYNIEKTRYNALLNDLQLLATSSMSSDGEKQNLVTLEFVKELGSFVYNNKSSKELWVLIDSIDEKLSIDMIDEIKNLFKQVLKDNENKDVYIIVATNNYAMIDCETCLDVTSARITSFLDYDDYEIFILNSRKYKDERFNSEIEEALNE